MRCQLKSAVEVLLPPISDSPMFSVKDTMARATETGTKPQPNSQEPIDIIIYFTAVDSR